MGQGAFGGIEIVACCPIVEEEDGEGRTTTGAYVAEREQKKNKEVDARSLLEQRGELGVGAFAEVWWPGRTAVCRVVVCGCVVV